MYIKTNTKNRESILSLIVQYLEKYSRTLQQLTYRGWHACLHLWKSATWRLICKWLPILAWYIEITKVYLHFLYVPFICNRLLRIPVTLCRILSCKPLIKPSVSANYSPQWYPWNWCWVRPNLVFSSQADRVLTHEKWDLDHTCFIYW